MSEELQSMCQIGNLCDDKAAVSCKCHRNMARQSRESGPKLMASFSSHWLKKIIIVKFLVRVWWAISMRDTGRIFCWGDWIRFRNSSTDCMIVDDSCYNAGTRSDDSPHWFICFFSWLTYKLDLWVEKLDQYLFVKSFELIDIGTV